MSVHALVATLHCPVSTLLSADLAGPDMISNIRMSQWLIFPPYNSPWILFLSTKLLMNVAWWWAGNSSPGCSASCNRQTGHICLKELRGLARMLASFLQQTEAKGVPPDHPHRQCCFLPAPQMYGWVTRASHLHPNSRDKIILACKVLGTLLATCPPQAKENS